MPLPAIAGAIAGVAGRAAVGMAAKGAVKGAANAASGVANSQHTSTPVDRQSMMQPAQFGGGNEPLF